MKELKEYGLLESYNNVVNYLNGLHDVLEKVDDEVNDKIVEYVLNKDYSSSVSKLFVVPNKVKEFSQSFQNDLDEFLSDMDNVPEVEYVDYEDGMFEKD